MTPYSSTQIGPALRRKIVLVATDGRVDAAVEDDYHHFSVAIEHDGSHITGLTSQHLRTPWVSCASAGAQLQALLGMALAREQWPLAHIDPHFQCTHQYDLALLACAHALRGGRREYEIAVTDAINGQRRALVLRDGQACIDWQLAGSSVVAPPSQAGIDLRKLDLAQLALDDSEHAEAVTVLRRAVMIAGGRGIDLDQYPDLSQFAQRMSGACHAFQPINWAAGKRNKNTVHDFSTHPESLLIHFKP